MEGTKKIYVAGNYIEKQEFHITGGTNYINTPDDNLWKNSGSEGKDAEQDNDLLSNLSPIFYNDENKVKEFLRIIRGMKDNEITDLVNKWVEDKQISDFAYSRKGALWKLLHEAGLYKSTPQNWNRRVH